MERARVPGATVPGVASLFAPHCAHPCPCWWWMGCFGERRRLTTLPSRGRPCCLGRVSVPSASACVSVARAPRRPAGLPWTSPVQVQRCRRHIHIVESHSEAGRGNECSGMQRDAANPATGNEGTDGQENGAASGQVRVDALERGNNNNGWRGLLKGRRQAGPFAAASHGPCPLCLAPHPHDPHATCR